jgi:hypothetical protein
MRLNGLRVWAVQTQGFGSSYGVGQTRLSWAADLFIHEMVRALKKGGRFIIATPFFWHAHYEPNDYYRFTQYGLTYLLEKNNIEIRKVVLGEGIIALSPSLLADRAQRLVNGKLHFFPVLLRILLYQIILFHLANIIYPFAKYEFGREVFIKLGCIVIGVKQKWSFTLIYQVCQMLRA